LRTVLADHLDAGVQQQAELVGGDVLRRDDDRDVGADLGLDARVPLAELLRRRRR
jgi:hypothetical protein